MLPKHEPPFGWQRDENGNLFRGLTPAERAALEATREQRLPPSGETLRLDNSASETDIAQAS